MLCIVTPSGGMPPVMEFLIISTLDCISQRQKPIAGSLALFSSLRQGGLRITPYLTPDFRSRHSLTSLSLRHVIHLRTIVRRVRSKCFIRRESLVLNMKKDLNRLASSLLSELTAAASNGPPSQKLKSSEDKDDDRGDNDSLGSDPLGRSAH